MINIIILGIVALVLFIMYMGVTTAVFFKYFWGILLVGIILTSFSYPYMIIFAILIGIGLYWYYGNLGEQPHKH